jgi:hypothetical protein
MTDDSPDNGRRKLAEYIRQLAAETATSPRFLNNQPPRFFQFQPEAQPYAGMLIEFGDSFEPYRRLWMAIDTETTDWRAPLIGIGFINEAFDD